MFTILELYNEEDNSINHHGFTRDVSVIKAFEETEKDKKKYLRDIAKFIGNFLL